MIGNGFEFHFHWRKIENKHWHQCPSHWHTFSVFFKRKESAKVTFPFDFTRFCSNFYSNKSPILSHELYLIEGISCAT